MPAPQDPTASKWDELARAFSTEGSDSALTLCVYLTVGGLLAFYVRALYSRTSRNASADSVARVFPLLTLVTITVISVVKSSLALSLGLVGALSIVRFRAAIKDPEELVYLFLCIGIGLSLGASQPWLALTLVAIATVFVLAVDRLRPGAGGGAGYLTVIGPASHFSNGDASALATVRRAWPASSVQRCEVDGDEGQLRVTLRNVRDDDGPRIVAEVQAALRECHVSFLDAEVLA